MSKEAKQVIVVRKDLNMRKGKIAAQVAHASLGAFLNLMTKTKVNMGKNTMVNGLLMHDTPEFAWLDGPFTKICVSCDSEAELFDLVKKAKAKGILNCLITDAGRTEFNGVATVTCAAFGPEWSDKLDELTGHLKLL